MSLVEHQYLENHRYKCGNNRLKLLLSGAELSFHTINAGFIALSISNIQSCVFRTFSGACKKRRDSALSVKTFIYLQTISKLHSINLVSK